MGFINKNKVAENNVSDLVKEMVILYSEMIKTRKKLEVKEDANERVRYQKLECKVDPLWSKLTRNEQIMAVSQLIEAGFMNSNIGEMLIMFEGKIDMVMPPEPCWRV